MHDLVHDLRQPLSIIESTAYYLEMMSSDAAFASHLQHIQKMVGETHRILEQATAPQAH
jgi:light-regulated signal transduction histidine kinase (bacteriophytochrome)